MSRPGADLQTPVKPLPAGFIDEEAETPAPQRARIQSLQKQVSELVRKEHTTVRRHTSEISEKNEQISALREQVKQAVAWKHKAETGEGELKRLLEDGERMREELNLFSVIAQQKALLAVADEQLKLVEMEQWLSKAKAATLMRDHKIALFKAKEEDLAAELAEKDTQMSDLESALEEANTSLVHQRVAQAKASMLQVSTSTQNLDDALAKISSLETKVGSLDAKLRSSKEREHELKTELDSALASASGGGSDKERREMQKAVRDTKAEVSKYKQELSDVREELESLKETSKERERALKTKIKEAVAERDKLIGVEEELESLKFTVKAKTSPRKIVKPDKIRKAVSSDESEVEVPKKKARKESPKKKIQPAESDSDVPYKPDKETLKPNKSKAPTSILSRKLPDSDKPKPRAVVQDDDRPEPEKKKKRKLFGAQPAFTWDPIMNSGDGVIPTHLTPAKPAGKKPLGVIPRAGFAARGLGRIQ